MLHSLRSTAWMTAFAACPLLAAADTAVPDAVAEQSDPPAEARAEASPEQIAEWIGDLDSGEFGVRNAATRKLIEAGRAAVEPVAEAADADDLEKAARCIGVLGRLVRSEDAETQRAAEAALKKLAGSDRKSVAQRATAALPQPDPVPVGFDPFGNIQIQVGGARVQGRNVRIQMRTVNGNREVAVEEDGRKLHITDSQGKDIVVRVSETVEGKEQTKEYKAKDAAELKEKHPEAHELFEKYASRGNLPVQVLGGALPIQPLPIRVPPPPPPPGVRPAEQKEPAEGDAERVEQARKRFEQAIDELRRQTGQPGVDPEVLRKLVEEIREAGLELQRAAGGRGQ